MCPLAEHLHPGDAGDLPQDRHRLAVLAHDDFVERARQRQTEHAGAIAREKPSVVQQGDARATLRLVEVRRRHDNRDALRQKLRQQLPELAARDRIHACRRLVEHDERRLVNQRASEGELLLHAAREAIGEARAERRELRHLQQAIAPGDVVADAVNLGEERDVLVDAQIAVQAEPL